MPPDVAAAPFEPMRRGAPPSAGAGLGLSIARGIVRRTAAGSSWSSRPQGTCFRICLPVENPEMPGRDARPRPSEARSRGWPAGPGAGEAVATPARGAS